MSWIFDSSAIFEAIKRNAVEYLADSHTAELARYELSNVLWKEHTLYNHISSKELDRLIELVKRILSSMRILDIECQEKEVLSIARKLRITFYDACYVHHAKRLDASLVTEDLVLTKKVKQFIKASRISEVLGST